ncbi:HNH endonuclease [Aeromonas hydrophila]|nr:HNH endonuclease [Aeromonas hydrophila]
MGTGTPDYPFDLEELKHIETLLSKIPLYKEKLTELHKEIDAVAKKASALSPLSNHYEIESLIYKAFYSSIENRPFNEVGSSYISRLKAEIKWDGEILNRNLPCEICGENRSIDRCHIIPNKLGGTQEEENILLLCPTHHRLFDRFMLSKAEWVQIDWDRKAESSRIFAENVTLEAHKVFWKKVEQGHHETINPYELNEKPFIKYVVSNILSLLTSGRLTKQSNIYKMLDKSLKKISKIAIPILIKHRVIDSVKNGSGNSLILINKNFDIDHIVLEIWQKT